MNIEALNIIRTSILNLPPLDPVVIEGPVSVSEYISDSKRIYLFGDVHTRAKSCIKPDIKTITLEKFLESTFNITQTK